MGNAAPAINGQPQSMVVNAHDTASFSVTAYGSLALSYQWLLNGTNIPWATSNILTITNVSQTNLGTYVVVVTDDSGQVTSSNAVLSMYPFIATPFTGAVAYWGQSSTLSIQAWGSGPLAYQWYQNGVSIPNATNQSFTLTDIQFTNAGLYSVVVSNAFGSATNTPEQVIVEPAGVSIGGLYPGIIINGTVGYNYVIQSSANLADTNSWITVTNLTLTQPIQLWIDTNTDASQPGNPQMFYQILPGQ
ncbi:MAG: immunoglobulin domain-containing protein [Limisphaerales bacterium]